MGTHSNSRAAVDRLRHPRLNTESQRSSWHGAERPPSLGFFYNLPPKAPHKSVYIFIDKLFLSFYTVKWDYVVKSITQKQNSHPRFLHTRMILHRFNVNFFANSCKFYAKTISRVYTYH